jgi:microsomal dipeptidase-like Zn-dependent dipeptidase
LNIDSEGEIKSIKKLKKKLKEEGYSYKAIREICKWYE